MCPLHKCTLSFKPLVNSRVNNVLVKTEPGPNQLFFSVHQRSRCLYGKHIAEWSSISDCQLGRGRGYLEVKNPVEYLGSFYTQLFDRISYYRQHKMNEKSAQRRRKHCTLTVVRPNQKFSPTTDPLPGARDGQNLISWRCSLPLPTNPVW